MKKFSSFFLISAAIALSAVTAGCSKTGSINTDSPENITFKWQDVYEAKLDEIKNEEGFNIDTASFDLLDLTGNGSPELIVSPNVNSSTPCHVYTCERGEIKDFGEVGNFGSFIFLPQTKIIKDEYAGEGFVLGKLYSCTINGISQVLNYNDNSASASTGADIYHEINGERVMLSEYNSAMEPYDAGPEIKVGRKFSFGDNALHYGIRLSETWINTLNSEQKSLCSAKLGEKLSEADENSDPAFELCDLNGDNVPELIFSEGSSAECTCSIYYFTGGTIAQMDGTYGANGIFNFDPKEYVFFYNSGSEIIYWSIANPTFSAADYNNQGNTVELGRKYLLTDEIISRIFG